MLARVGDTKKGQCCYFASSFDRGKRKGAANMKTAVPIPAATIRPRPVRRVSVSRSAIPTDRMIDTVPGRNGFLTAQAIKDATMAASILKYLSEGKSAIHYNGSYHSDRYMGILWYINKYRPGLRMVTIATILQDDIEKMGDEGRGQADFVIVVPTSMTRTY